MCGWRKCRGRTRPLLAGRAQALKTEDDGEAGASADDDKAASGDPVKSEDEDVAIKPDPDANGDYDAAAAEALIRSATDRAQNRTAGVPSAIPTLTHGRSRH